MKKILPIIAAIALLASCHQAIWDKLNDHEARISRLEQMCNQFNTNINALQVLVNAINERDYIKDVVPLSENGVTVGYTVTFNKSNPINIYNGKNGQDAKAPVIGIRKEEDVWYWTLNGEWILDQDGNKVRADGVSPMLKIEEEKWWVSYDSGATWEQLGAIEGGQGGDSMFKEVKQDERFWYFILADGEEIKIAKGGLTWVYV